jgi:hypothetical protein
MATQDADGVVARANISVGILLSSEVNPTPRLAETIPAAGPLCRFSCKAAPYFNRNTDI